MIQPLYESVAATADSNGVATFTFQQVPAGLVWTGTLGIFSAPANAIFNARVGVPGAGLPWGSWGGNATFGPVQAGGRFTVSVTATGLVAGTNYQCSWVGSSCFEWEAQPVSPSALSTTTTISGGQQTRTFDASTLGGYILSESGVYATSRAGGGVLTAFPSTSSFAGQYLSGNYGTYEGFISFDTSAIPDSASIVSATLYLCIDTLNVVDAAFTLEARLWDWGGTVATGDWIPGATINGAPLTYPVGASIASSLITPGVRQALASTATLLAGINKAGSTRLITTSDKFVAGTVPTGNGQWCTIFGGVAAAAVRPQLVVVSSS